MIPLQGFILKENGGKSSKDDKGNYFLNNFELHQ